MELILETLAKKFPDNEEIQKAATTARQAREKHLNKTIKKDSVVDFTLPGYFTANVIASFKAEPSIDVKFDYLLNNQGEFDIIDLVQNHSAKMIRLKKESPAAVELILNQYSHMWPQP